VVVSIDRLSVHPHERLIQLLEELYAPGCEKQWVHYAVELLTSLARCQRFSLACLLFPLCLPVRVTSRSVDFKKPLHDLPLDPRFHFQQQDIDAFWGQSVAMNPMFSSDLSQYGGGVRATQSTGLQFSQTQTQLPDEFSRGAPAGAYLVSSFLPEGTLTQSAGGAGALIAMGDPTLTNGPSAFRPAMLLAERGSQASMGLTSLGVGVGTSAPRPLRPGSESSSYFMEQHLIARESKLAQALKIKNERRSHVQMFRKYRKGELPDIQITRKDLLDPLQALCERSSLFARQVWGELFRVRVPFLHAYTLTPALLVRS
jgi:hypothetical protein